MFLNRVVVYFFLRFRQLRESFKICRVRRCCAIIVFTGVQIPLALIRRGVNSKKILPTWTGVFLIWIKSGVSRLKFRALETGTRLINKIDNIITPTSPINLILSKHQIVQFQALLQFFFLLLDQWNKQVLRLAKINSRMSFRNHDRNDRQTYMRGFENWKLKQMDMKSFDSK